MIKETYQQLLNQGFIPIFVKDDFDSWMLIDACVDAKVKIIEYTLRREDAHSIIPEIKKRHPDLKILVGSTLDNNQIIRQQQQKNNQQLLTLDELAPYVDGFVSMFKYSYETLERFRVTHLLIPSAYTPNEAYELMINGAHLVKMLGSDLALVKQVMSAPSHGFCPIFVTGGATLERIPEIVNLGVVGVGSGFDLLLKNQPDDIAKDEIVKIIWQYLQVTQNAINIKYPTLKTDLANNNFEKLPFYNDVHFC